jgi:hypothetical protein
MKTMKMKDEKINLSINLNIKHKNQDKSIKCVYKNAKKIYCDKV